MNDNIEDLKLKSKKEEAQKLIALVEDIMDFKHWGFYQSSVDETTPKVIFDSEWCRVKFVSQGLNGHIEDHISIYYGRLHASNDSHILIWNGKLCYCWHRINEVLHFLDGLSPREAFDQFHVHRQWPRVMEQFRQSEFGTNLRYHQPEWITRMHVAVWEHYGQRLFKLFDLRQPALWEKYEMFFKEFYSLEPYLAGESPRPDRIC